MFDDHAGDFAARPAAGPPPSSRTALVGEHWQAVDLDLTDANYELFRTRGVSCTQRVAVKGEPRFVKVIVYDYTADLTGTAMVMIPAK